ncbi:MAG: hypothetical protein GXC78_16740 [Chitinophagaceae bacterium]|nr:hypothetical protein [Chitinophagaceae bacterium]
MYTSCFKKLFPVLLLILAATEINAQPAGSAAEDSIRHIVNTTFIAMKESDTILLKTCFTEGALLQTFAPGKGGKTTIVTETVSSFARSIASLPKGMADEQVEFERIQIDGHMAAVWAPFKLFLNGKFYSCGVNNIQLVRLNNEWKIQYILDTRRKDNCK